MNANLGQAIKSPIVWGGGAVIGLFLLMRSSQANANVSANMDAVNPAVISATTQANSAAYGAVIEQAHIAAGLGEAKFTKDVQEHALFYGFLKNFDNNATVQAQARMESDAGITNAMIASSTAIIIDNANNATRLGLGYQQVNIAQIQANRDVTISRYQTSAQKAVSKNNLIGTIVGSAAKVATTAMMA